MTKSSDIFLLIHYDISMDKPKYVGIDLHKRTSFITLMDQKGLIHAQVNLDNKEPEKILNVIKSSKGMSVAVEATMNWYWLLDMLQQERIPVSLVNPIKMKQISSSHKKTDKNDSRILAEGLKNNSLPLSYAAPVEVRDLRELVRWRLRLVRARRTTINSIHQALIKNNTTSPYQNIVCKKGIVWLKDLNIREPYKSQILMELDTIEKQKEQLVQIEEKIKEGVYDEKSLELLKTIPGISDTLGIMILAQIGDINRFDNPDSFCAYAGVVPRTHSSANHTYQGRIIKESDAILRTALSEAILHTIKKDASIKAIYEKLEKKKGKSIARVACMHRLATIIYRILSQQRAYEIR